MVKMNKELIEKVEEEIKSETEKIDRICTKNSIKVIKAFQECNLQEMHLQSSS